MPHKLWALEKSGEHMSNRNLQGLDRHGLTLEKRDISPRRDQEKYVFRLSDGLPISCVLIHDAAPGDPYRHTLSISAQAGCPLGCQFCASGLMGFLRNLSAAEIVEQYSMVKRASGSPITQVEIGSMGEPMLNYDAVISACYLLAEEVRVAPRQILIATSGLAPEIERFTLEGHPFQLAISLNATTGDTRSRIMPINRKYPLATLLHAAREYTRRTQQRITFKYMLLGGVNDTLADAERLTRLTRDMPCGIEIFPFVPSSASLASSPGGDARSAFRRPTFERTQAFLASLNEESVDDVFSPSLQQQKG
ncbi:MAG: radical SAM protein [Planctomycetes bacterium]|nr:radical SAM protein [Planctomycetota bacterium]